MRKTVIEPQGSWLYARLVAVWQRRELLYFLTKRDIQVRYRQTLLGGLWALGQPLISVAVFTLFLGKIAKSAGSSTPYPLFVFAGLVPWIYFAGSLHTAANSLISNVGLVTKVYFPRIIMPASSCLGGLLDLGISLVVLIIMALVYGVFPDARALFLPLALGLTFLAALAVGVWLAALNVRYRDVKYVLPFVTQLWFFVSPVIYPENLLGRSSKLLLALNPLTAVIGAYRFALLGTTPDWTHMAVSLAVLFGVLITGLFYFSRVEDAFADVI
jgi:lipopolysaccharide transport system permease protein